MQIMNVPEGEYIIFEHGAFEFESENQKAEAEIEKAMAELIWAIICGVLAVACLIITSTTEYRKMTACRSQYAKSWRSFFIPIFKKEVNPNGKTENIGVEIATPMLNS